jgi:prolipoprotein diacylglyceryltransferase
VADARKSLFVTRSEFYITAGLIFLFISGLAENQERAGSTLRTMIQTGTAVVLSITFMILGIVAAATARRERLQRMDGPAVGSER